MSLKKTDMVKNLAKKLDGQRKSAAIPNRFAKGSAAAAKPEPVKADTAPKPVQLTCRLPADLVQQMRDRAVSVEGGINTILAQALQRWLESQPPR
jgi:hypothetical protein